MKHTINVTLILISLFFVSQIIGLLIINSYYDKATGQFKPIMIANQEISRPPLEQTTSFLYIMATVLIGTLLVFLLIKLQIWKLWQIWFFLAILTTLTIALTPAINFMLPIFSPLTNSIITIILSLTLTYYKIFRHSIIIHNATELFVYAGIAAIFVPVMSMFAAFGLLILISIYDAWAVWKSKHMISLAKAQTKSGIFAGLFIPYEMPKKIPKGAKVVMKKTRNAVLGGGDIGFCLLFTGVAMKTIGLLPSMIIPIFSTTALAFLLYVGKKDRFYPAMPFLSTGCFIGFVVSLLISKLF